MTRTKRVAFCVDLAGLALQREPTLTVAVAVHNPRPPYNVHKLHVFSQCSHVAYGGAQSLSALPYMLGAQLAPVRQHPEGRGQLQIKQWTV